ncbi:MAG: hypothetical protein AAF317_02390, partial [Pseudomonadota bacterium]
DQPSRVILVERKLLRHFDRAIHCLFNDISGVKGKIHPDMRSSTNGKEVRLSDKSSGTQLFVKWFFRILYGWIALVFIALIIGFLFDPFSSN